MTWWDRRPEVAVTALADARDLIVRPHFRRAVAAALLFFGAAALTAALGGVHAKHTVNHVSQPWRTHQIGSWAAIAICLVSGVAVVRLVADEVARLARHRGSPAAAGSLHLIVQIIGFLAVLVAIMGLLSVRVESVLLSGAIGSVVIGLAAQQSLSNAFAGIVLLVSRPFVVGDYITLRAGALGGQYDGEVLSISLMYTIMDTQEGPMSLPNSAVLAAATGRRARPGPSDGPLIR